MLSNQAIINSLRKITDVSGTKIEVFTTDGVLLTADGAFRDESVKAIMRLIDTRNSVQRIEPYVYYQVYDNNTLAYLIRVGVSETDQIVAKMAVLQFETFIQSSQDRFSREDFIKNLLLDNLLLVDIYNRAKKLDLDTRKRRVAFLIETKQKDDIGAMELLKNMFADNEDDFITAIDESNIVLVKELDDSDNEKTLAHIARTIIDMMNSEAMTRASVAYGNIADEIRKVSNSYKEAKLALSVGKIFNPGENVISYSSLGIGRLIYQLPLPMCRMFIDEIFKGQSPDKFDEETLTTINKFFENSLNVSETSRQLYIHRNTLVYRLDKLQKNTGLDLRVFDDAITFKIALMVVKYMNYMENQF